MTAAHMLQADLFTLSRSRAVAYVAGSAALLGMALTAALAYTAGTDEPAADLSTAFGQGEILIDPITGLLIAALTAAFWGSSFRDGSILWSFLASRSRSSVALGAIVASAVVGLAVAAVTMGLKIATLHLTLPSGVSASWWTDQHGRMALVGALVSGLVMAIVGTCASLLTRNAPAAIAVVFVWMLVVEPLIVGLLPRSTWLYFPGHALSAMRNAVPDVDLGRAAVMVVLYVALTIGGATWALTRRDPA